MADVTEVLDPAHTVAEMVSERCATELSDITRRAMGMTRSAGAAIALVDGNELVTCASSGECVPGVGTRQPIAGFTGLCIQKAETLTCDDTQTDARVDAAACKALEVNSIVVVPLKQARTVLGVLAVFFGPPRAFTRSYVALLRTLADVTAILLQRDAAERKNASAPTAVSSQAEASGPNVNVTPPSPIAPDPDGTVAVLFEPGSHHEPAASATMEANAPPEAAFKAIHDEGQPQPRPILHQIEPPTAPAAECEPAPLPMVTKAQPQRNVVAEQTTPSIPSDAPQPFSPKLDDLLVLAIDPEREATPGISRAKLHLQKPIAKEKYVAAASADGREPSVPKPIAPKPTPAMPDNRVVPAAIPVTKPMSDRGNPERELFAAATLAQRSPGAYRRVLLPLAGTAVVALAIGGFLLYRSSVAKAAPRTAAGADPVLEVAATTPAPVESGQPETVPIAVPPASKPAAGATESKTKSTRAAAATAAPADLTAPVPIRILSGGSSMKAGKDASAVEPPALTFSDKSGPVGLPEPKPAIPEIAPRPVAASGSTARAPVNSLPARVLQTKPLAYPRLALTRHIEGRVLLRITVGKQGNVIGVRAIKGPALLQGPAADAARTWRYAPGSRDGSPVESEFELAVDFKLPPGL